FCAPSVLFSVGVATFRRAKGAPVIIADGVAELVRSAPATAFAESSFGLVGCPLCHVGFPIFVAGKRELRVLPATALATARGCETLAYSVSVIEQVSPVPTAFRATFWPALTANNSDHAAGMISEAVLVAGVPTSKVARTYAVPPPPGATPRR